jgi:hypothetical protein
MDIVPDGHLLEIDMLEHLLLRGDRRAVVIDADVVEVAPRCDRQAITKWPRQSGPTPPACKLVFVFQLLGRL